jgi:MFS family permease
MSKFSRDTICIVGANLFADMSTEMLTPILPIFLTQALHANGSIVGLVDGIAQAIRNMTDGFSGPLSDKLRNRKGIAAAGYAMSAVAKPLMGLSPIWEGVLGARIFDRLGAGARSAPRDAIVASSVDRGHRGRGFGLEGLGENAGAFVGPIATLLLLYALQLDIRTIFYLASLPGLVAFTIILFVEQQPPPQEKMKINIRPTDFPLDYWKFLIAIAIFSIGNSSNSFLILRTQEAGASALMTTFVYAGFNLIAALVSYPLASLSDRLGRKNVILGSFFVFLIAYLGFALTLNIVVVVAMFLFYGAYQGSFRSVSRALASDLAPEHLRASGIGWFSATVGLCQLIASLVGGLLWDVLGHSSTFLYGIASGLAGIVATTLLVPGGRERRPDERHG